MADSDAIAFHDFGPREQMNSEEMADIFTEVASTYDETWRSMHYMDHVYVAEGVAGYYGDKVTEGVRILDVAAGTGMLAEELWKRGFRHIDGLDPSEGMKKEALKKKVYTKYFLEYMDGKQLESIQTGAYDCLVVAAAFNTGLLPCVALVEMVRLVKPDGLMCFGIPDSRFTEVKDYIERLAPLMSRMESEGAWSLHDKTHYKEFYDNSGPGTIYRYIVKSPGLDLQHIVHKL